MPGRSCSETQAARASSKGAAFHQASALLAEESGRWHQPAFQEGTAAAPPFSGQGPGSHLTGHRRTPAPERRTSGAYSRDSAKAPRKRLPSLTEAGRRSQGMIRHRPAEAGLDLPQTDAELEKLAVKVYEQDIAKNKKMGEYGAEVVPEEAVILTHCNAGALATCGWGTALGVIRSAHEQGKVKMVYSDETRPLLQGSRLTAWELLEDNIPVTTITDNMAAWSMKTKGINIVITGADRIAANGDTANKIGTYGVALAAKAHGIPFYIAAPASTFDFSLKNGTQIPIEERNANEVRSFQGKVSAPKNVNVFNPAFDVTPAKLIAGIITEYGVLRPPFSKSIKELKTKVLREELFTWKA